MSLWHSGLEIALEANNPGSNLNNDCFFKS